MAHRLTTRKHVPEGIVTGHRITRYFHPHKSAGCSLQGDPLQSCLAYIVLGFIEIDKPLTTVHKTDPGTTAILWVRGGAWIWGPLKKDCPLTGFEPGEAHSLVFECEEAN